MTKEQIAIIKKARSECHAGMGATAAATLYSLLLDVEKQEQGEPVAEIKGFDGNGAVLRWFIKSTDFPAGTKFYTTPQQPEALRLADALEKYDLHVVASELRRLHKVNAELEDALQPFVLANSSEEHMILVVRTTDMAKARAALYNKALKERGDL